MESLRFVTPEYVINDIIDLFWSTNDVYSESKDFTTRRAAKEVNGIPVYSKEEKEDVVAVFFVVDLETGEIQTTTEYIENNAEKDFLALLESNRVYVLHEFFIPNIKQIANSVESAVADDYLFYEAKNKSQKEQDFFDDLKKVKFCQDKVIQTQLINQMVKNLGVDLDYINIMLETIEDHEYLALV